jgi:hypothetical protein
MPRCDLDQQLSVLDRLNASHQVQASKRRSFAHLQVTPGSFVLGIGCGAGDDARALAELVGPTGHVRGVTRMRPWWRKPSVARKVLASRSSTKSPTPMTLNSLTRVSVLVPPTLPQLSTIESPPTTYETIRPGARQAASVDRSTGRRHPATSPQCGCGHVA